METVVSCLVGLKEQEWYSQTLMTRGNAVGGAVGIHDVKCPERDGKNATPIEQYTDNLREILRLLKPRAKRIIW